jgi:hypothetical protein
MAKIDPEQERNRVVEFYSRQLDGELESVATQAYELTEIAQIALRSELARRGLSVELVLDTPPKVTEGPQITVGDPAPAEASLAEAPDGELELRNLVTVRKFRDLPEALLAKGSLESAGIAAVLTDDNIIRMDWFWSNLMGGIKLQVDMEEVEAASGILDQPIPEGFDVAGVGEYQQPRCPKCQSLDISFMELDRPVAYVSAFFNVPIPWHRAAWRCHSCHAEWEDDGVSETPASEK